MCRCQSGVALSEEVRASILVSLLCSISSSPVGVLKRIFSLWILFDRTLLSLTSPRTFIYEKRMGMPLGTLLVVFDVLALHVPYQFICIGVTIIATVFNRNYTYVRDRLLSTVSTSTVLGSW